MIIGDDSGGICKTKTVLAAEILYGRRRGKLWYYLGVKVTRSQTSINISQRKFVLD